MIKVVDSFCCHFYACSHLVYFEMSERHTIYKDLDIKAGFPVMAETTRNHIFSKEISQVIIAAMVLAPNFY